MPFPSDTLISQYDVIAINMAGLKLEGGEGGTLTPSFCEDTSTLLMACDVILILAFCFCCN
jgi:hypothetical protein